MRASVFPQFDHPIKATGRPDLTSPAPRRFNRMRGNKEAKVGRAGGHRSELGAEGATGAQVLHRLGGRPIVLVGMMGAGKTTVGRRLANRLGWQFVDSDTEIEAAAGMSIPDFFAAHGEADFRAGEARVIARLLKQPHMVLGTGGGAFMNPQTRSLIKKTGVSVWIKADFEVLFARVSRRPTRPLLQTVDPKATLKRLIKERDPVYAEADITVCSREGPHEEVVDGLIEALANYLQDGSPKMGEPDKDTAR